MSNKLTVFWAALFIAIALILLAACLPEISIPVGITSSAEPASARTPALRPTPNLNCPNGDCANACLAQLSSVLQFDAMPGSPPKSALQHQQGDKSVVLVTYQIKDNQLSSPKFSSNIPANLSGLQQDTASQQKIWDYFAAIIPTDRRSELINFIVSTDGKGEMLASVEQYSNQPKYWALNVDIVDAAKPRNLTFTLIHEFGHLLTLNDSQITLDPKFLAHPDDLQLYQQEAASCPQYFSSVGCSQSNSYLNQFFAEFWPKIHDEWSKVNAAKDQGDYSSLLARFYRNHPTQFISPYAATSPEEDIAESWAYFVLSPKPADDSIAHRKVLFFYNFPELVDLRNQIIYGICNYASSQ